MRVQPADVVLYDMAVVRYTSEGELDPTFSDDGITTIDFGFGQWGLRRIRSRCRPTAGSLWQDQRKKDAVVLTLAVARLTARPKASSTRPSMVMAS